VDRRPARRAAPRGVAHRGAGRRRPGRTHPAPGGDGAGLPHPGAGHAVARGRGGAAPAPGQPARFGAHRGAVCPGRADHRAARPRHPAAGQHAALAARPGQHRAGHRARHGDDPLGRLGGRFRPRRRAGWRGGRGPGHTCPGGSRPALAHRPLPRGLSADRHPPAAPCTAGGRAAHRSRGGRA